MHAQAAALSNDIRLGMRAHWRVGHQGCLTGFLAVILPTVCRRDRLVQDLGARSQVACVGVASFLVGQVS